MQHGCQVCTSFRLCHHDMLALLQRTGLSLYDQFRSHQAVDYFHVLGCPEAEGNRAAHDLVVFHAAAEDLLIDRDHCRERQGEHVGALLKQRFPH